MEDIVRSHITKNSKYISTSIEKNVSSDQLYFSLFVTLPTNGRVIRFNNTFSLSSKPSESKMLDDTWKKCEAAIIHEATRLWQKNSNMGRKDIELPEEFSKPLNVPKKSQPAPKQTEENISEKPKTSINETKENVDVKPAVKPAPKSNIVEEMPKTENMVAEN
jgi:hypothetical protein